MSGQKTEPPTPKKLKNARREGQVFRSNDITQALLFLTAVAVISIGGGAYFLQLKSLLADSFRPEVLTGQLRTDELLRRTGAAWLMPLLYLAPLLGSLFLVGAAVNLLQVKPLFAPKVLQPKFDRLNPLKGLQNLFLKPKTYLELLKNLLKFSIVLAVVYVTVRGSIRDIVMTAGARLDTSSGFAADLMLGLLLRVAAAFLVIGAADFFLQKRLYLKELMMSKYEVQKEVREEEGDPHVKHSRQQLHASILAYGMMNKVPKADAVIVNPTHLAIAIEYDEASMSAPAVTAKGQLEMAKKIVELATRHHVPIVRNVPLAHSLFALDLGQEVPEELYEAVAEILNWVFMLAQTGQSKE